MGHPLGGAKSSRPQWEVLRTGEVLVCTRLDRVGRATAHLVPLLANYRSGGKHRTHTGGCPIPLPRGTRHAGAAQPVGLVVEHVQPGRSAAPVEIFGFAPACTVPTGTTKRSPSTLATLLGLREALRSGDIWVPGSRRYADPTTLLALADKHRISDLQRSLAEIRSWYEFRDFPHFLEVYRQAVDVLRDEEDFAVLAAETIRTLARQNVGYAEVNFSLSNHLTRGIPAEVVFAGLEQGREQVEAEHDITIRWVPDFAGDFGVAAGQATLEAVLAHGPASVLGFSVGGLEVERDPFADLFTRARAHGLRSLPHAGETEGPDRVWSAIHALGADRIGHGIGSMRDPALVDYLREQQLPLDVPPTSNLCTRSVTSLQEHPLPHMLDAGLLVTLDSDDPRCSAPTSPANTAPQRGWDSTARPLIPPTNGHYDHAVPGQKVLVTGSAGHLGEALVRVLRDQGREVVGLDVNSSQFTAVVGSITDREVVRECLRGVDTVLHAATLHKPHVGSHDQQAFVDTNITGTLVLLEEAVAAGVARFVFTSTTSTFGHALTPDAGEPAAWITEDVTSIPKNIYGVTKTAAENLCELVHREHGLPVVVLRTSRFFPELDDRDDVRARYTDANVKANEFLYRRVDVADVADAHLAAAQRAPQLGFGRYIISATTPFDPDDLAELGQDAAAVVRRLLPEVDEVYAQRGWTLFPRLDRVYINERARVELAWRPRYDFRHVLDRIAADDDPRSPLARAVGAKGYHSVSTGVYTVR